MGLTPCQDIAAVLELCADGDVVINVPLLFSSSLGFPVVDALRHNAASLRPDLVTLQGTANTIFFSLGLTAAGILLNCRLFIFAHFGGWVVESKSFCLSFFFF